MSFKRELSISNVGDEWIKEEIQEVGVNLLSALSVKTPVDEGTAVYSWIVSIGTKDDSEKTSDSKEAARAQMVSIEAPKLSRAVAGIDVFVQNNQPYIGRLNDGYSQKAPKNFVEESISIAVSGA